MNSLDILYSFRVIAGNNRKLKRRKDISYTCCTSITGSLQTLHNIGMILPPYPDRSNNCSLEPVGWQRRGIKGYDAAWWDLKASRKTEIWPFYSQDQNKLHGHRKLRMQLWMADSELKISADYDSIFWLFEPFRNSTGCALKINPESIYHLVLCHSPSLSQYYCSLGFPQKSP